MTPINAFAQTPVTPVRGNFCACCCIKSITAAKFFNCEHDSRSQPPSRPVASCNEVNESSLNHKKSCQAGDDLKSTSIDGYLTSKAKRTSKSEEHRKFLSCSSMDSQSSSDQQRNPMLTVSVFNNIRSTHQSKYNEPVFAEMNQMLTRVGIKLDRSAPPSRRGSPPRPPILGLHHHPKDNSIWGTARASPENLRIADLAANLDSTTNYSLNTSRSVGDDKMVTVTGDAHLLRLQQACQEQMQLPSFSSKEMTETSIREELECDDGSSDESVRKAVPPHSSRQTSSSGSDIKEWPLRTTDDGAKKVDEHSSTRNIDRSFSVGSPSVSIFSSELVYSTSSTSRASTFSSACMSPISHSGSNNYNASSAASPAKDYDRMVNVSIAYSEVLQLQGNPMEAVTVVETLLRTLEAPLMHSASNPPKDDKDVKTTLGTITLPPGRSPVGSEKYRPPPPSEVPGSTVPELNVRRSLTSADSSYDRDVAKQHTAHVATCHRRLGVLYKVVGRLPEAEKSLKCFVALKEEMEAVKATDMELEGRTDIANAYCLLAAVVDQMVGRADEASEYDRLALELMAQK